MSLGATLDQKIYQNIGNRLVLDAVPIQARTVLDIGCGAGDNARRLHERGLIVDGITCSAGEAVLARRFCRNLIVWNLEDGLPNGLADTYDVCIFSHALEHICRPEALLRGIQAKIKNHGRLIVALPNIMMWRYRIPLVFGNFEYTETGVMDRTHVRWYTVKSGTELFSSSGFRLEQMFVEGHFPLSGFRRILPHQMTTLIDSIAGRIAPGLFGLQMIYVLSNNRQSEAEVD